MRLVLIAGALGAAIGGTVLELTGSPAPTVIVIFLLWMWAMLVAALALVGRRP